MESSQKLENLPNEEKEFKGAFSLVERVDMKALRIIRDNFEEVFNRMGKKMKLTSKGKVKYAKDYKQAYTKINELYKSKCNSDIVKYKYSTRSTFGRRFEQTPSLQNCCKKIRHAIAKTIYYDIDIKNAHPTFLYQKYKVLGYHNPILQEYVEGDREGFLKSLFGLKVCKSEEDDDGNQKFINFTISTRDEAKEYFLQLLNGGGNGNTGNSNIDYFYKIHQNFLKMFYTRPENKKYYDKAHNASKNKNWENKEGSALNYYLCDVENKILCLIEEYLMECNIDYGTLCFDGLMIYKETVKEDVNSLLKNIEKRLFERVGYSISLSVKEMNEGVDLTGLTQKEDVDMSEEGLAKYMLETLKEDIKYSKKRNTLFKYNSKTALWEEFKIEWFKTLISTILIPHIKEDPDEDKIEKGIEMVKGNTKQNNIIQQMKPYIEMMNDDIFIDENFDAGNGLFPIADNKVMDFKTLTVRDRTRSDFFTRTTNRKYLENYDIEFVKKYYHDVLVKIKDDESNDEKIDESNFCSECKTNNKICPSKDYVDCLCYTFACIMTGEMNRSMKKFINLVGEGGNNGKSLFIEVHQKILESFSGSVASRVIIEQKNKSAHDAELFGLIDKWMMCLSETSKNVSYDEIRLKQITGYDSLQLRDAGGNSKSMVEVKFKAVPVVATNEMCQFKTKAFMNRLMCFAFVNYFEQDSSFASKILNMADDFFSYLCSFANSYYKNDKTFKICKEVQAETERIKKEQDSVLLWLEAQEIFEVCDNKPLKQEDEEEHRLPTIKLYESYRSFCDGDNIKPLGKTNFHKDFQQKFKLSTSKLHVKINTNGDKKQMECYTGLRIKSDYNMFEMVF